jgi:GDP-mannose 6-dehydrogenase
LEFGVGYNPEFMREGKGIYDFYHPARIVIGEYDPLTADRLEELYKGIDAPVVRESMRLAELIKYADNAFHALKIGFTNEVAMLAHQLGIDSRRLMEVFCLDTRLNISNSYLRPGFAFGGSCLPKDLRALTYLAHTLQVRTPILDSVLTSNREHIQRAIQLIKDNPSSSVGVIGLTFKPETDDVRESPALELVSELVAAGIKVWVMDSNLNANTIFGSNRRYIEEKFPTIWDHLVEDINGLLAYTDCIVITRDLQDKELRAVSRAVDTHRVIDLSGALYQRISHPNVVHLC